MAVRTDSPAETNWPLRLFKKSVLKQQKHREITRILGPTKGLTCLDVGGDNGVISYLLRQQGGIWHSADIDEQCVRSIRELVGENVHKLEGPHLPFGDNFFDRVVVVDYLEHIPQDRQFLQEVHRVLKPGGMAILNMPHAKEGFLRWFRYRLGQTDEKHGHVRHGYNRDSLQDMLQGCFRLEEWRFYSGFYIELVDTLIVATVKLVKGKRMEGSRKGLIITGKDLREYQKLFRIYSLIYPFVWLFSRLDVLTIGRSGYMLIARAEVTKEGSQTA